MVSIIIPARNESSLLYEVLDNLLDGTDHNLFEIIIVNDGSCDSGGRFASMSFDPIKYSNIRVLNNPVQHGVGYCFDRGAESARGNIVVLSGADVFPRRVIWLHDIIEAVNGHPDTIGCAVSLGLHGDERDLDREGISKRYGARLLVQVDINDLPENSPIKKQNPEYTALFEAKWLNEKQSDEPYEIPCALGAFYFTTKMYYQKIGGWDTDPTKRFQGHKYWGALETYLSLKSWLYGGGVTLFPNIEVAHVFGRIEKKDIFKHRACRPVEHWGNRLFMAHTMVMDENLRKKIIDFAKPELNLGKAKKYIRQNYNNVLAIKNRNKLGFVNSFEYFCEKFDIKIK